MFRLAGFHWFDGVKLSEFSWLTKDSHVAINILVNAHFRSISNIDANYFLFRNNPAAM